jgi:pimeloyl-ACP methyl ester carboxylesterase
MKVYFIAGIGADRRIFNHIELPEGYETEYLDWIAPIQDESLQAYASRLAQKIDPSQPFILIGVSLGGIIATELGKSLHPKATILISSISKSSQLPPYYLTAKMLNLHKMVPTGLIKASAKLKHILIKQGAEDREIIMDMINQADPFFVKWAMQAVLEWKNEINPNPLWHIHGTRDDIFPIKFTTPTHIMRRAGHSLITTHWKELNRILEGLMLQSVN